MHIHFALVIGIIVATFWLKSTHCQVIDKKCNVTRHDEADICMQKMFLIGDRSQRFRETLKQMKGYCRQILELQNCVKRFSRECLPELGRQVASLLLYGVQKVNRQYCGSERGMRRFNVIAKCGNHEIGRKHDCMDTFLRQLRLVERRADEEMVDTRIHYVCCFFSQFGTCVANTFERSNSSDRCPTEDVKQAVIDLINGYADDALDMVCGEFDGGGSKCDSLLTKSPLIDDDVVDEEVERKEDKNNKKSMITTTTKVAKSILPYFVGIFSKL